MVYTVVYWNEICSFNNTILLILKHCNEKYHILKKNVNNYIIYI